MHALLPRQGVDPEDLVDHQGSKCERQRYEDCEHGTGDHEQVPLQIHKSLPEEVEEPAHSLIRS